MEGVVGEEQVEDLFLDHAKLLNCFNGEVDVENLLVFLGEFIDG